MRKQKNNDMITTSATFDEAMFELYDRAKQECGYVASYFLLMLKKNGGLATAKKLLAQPGASKGFTRLTGYDRPDLTVEALVLRPKWSGLFSADELAVARRRLAECSRTSIAA